jgi:hypothetical protein
MAAQHRLSSNSKLEVVPEAIRLAFRLQLSQFAGYGRRYKSSMSTPVTADALPK